jgi:Kef-type K+ transport system membrane component KefB/Trk K+ transport system NAD-binding subunit
MDIVFIQLAVILFTAFIAAYLIRSFKQPIIIGYIVAGVIIALILESGITGISVSSEILDIFPKLGIAFLLFIVGLHLNPRIVKEIGVSSFFVGLAQIVLTFLLGFFVSWQLLGLGVVVSVYIGIALSFSSTIIVMKLLSDERSIDSLYGKISIGILIIQDLVAVAVLMVISAMYNGTDFSSIALKTLLGGAGLIAGVFLAGFLILPRVTKSIAKSQELLFLFSITWAFGVAALFSYVGFSIEIGALMAGISLSISPYSTEISSKIRPLRDFFLIIFFIILGLNIHVQSIGKIIANAAILSAVVLIFKPLIIMSFMALFRYTKRTNFLVGTTLAQISEFSLIVLALGVSLGHISGEILSTLTLTGIITITLSTYLIIYPNKIYKKFYKLISVFERKNARRDRRIKKSYDAILFGYNRIGFNILKALKSIRKSYLVVDFNPDIISSLQKHRVPCMYGDGFDSDFLEELPLKKIRLAISTVPDFETNVLLIESIRLVNPDAIIIVRAHQINEAMDLYRKGANYVLTPHFLGGEYVAKMIRELKTEEKEYKGEKDKHIKMLKEMQEKGHKHPHVEKN